jgi:shikimate kinase
VGGIRARPRAAWAGLVDKTHGGACSARPPAVRFTAEKLPRRLVLGTDPWRRSTDPGLLIRAAKLKASCSKKSAGEQSDCLSCC